MRFHFKRLQGVWTAFTGFYGAYTYNVRKVKKGDGIWRKMQKVVKQKDVDFKTTYVIC